MGLTTTRAFTPGLNQGALIPSTGINSLNIFCLKTGTKPSPISHDEVSLYICIALSQSLRDPFSYVT